MEVITLNKSTFSKKCSELISKLDTKVDLVIGILNGGGYVIEEFKNNKKYNSVYFQQVDIQRDDNLKHNFVVKFLLKILPYHILNKLRNYESLNAKKSIDSLNALNLTDIKINFKLTSSTNKSIKNIVIVDDAIDTGRTMFIVKNKLSSHFPKINIITAVISWTIETSLVKPDYYLYKNTLIRFPWSKDYKGKDFEKKSFSS